MLPIELLSNKKLDSSIFNSKCSTLLGIIQLVEEIFKKQYENLSTIHIQHLLEILETTSTKAQEIYLKYKNESLSKIEINAWAAYFRILAKMYSEKDDKFKDRVNIAEQLLIPYVFYKLLIFCLEEVVKLCNVSFKMIKWFYQLLN